MEADRPLFTKYEKQLRLALIQEKGDTSVFYEQLLRKIRTASPNADAFGKAADLLTPTEYKVLQLLLEGRANAFIASSMNISIETVKSHCKIFTKTRVQKSRRSSGSFRANDQWVELAIPIPVPSKKTRPSLSMGQPPCYTGRFNL